MNVKPLSQLELAIMEIIWACGECTVRDVVDRLDKTKPLAYTTVATVMTRLTEKGAIKKQGEGLSITYVPKLTKEHMSKTVAKSFLSKFIHSFGDAAFSSFAESIEELPKDKKNYLLKLLNEYEQEDQ